MYCMNMIIVAILVLLCIVLAWLFSLIYGLVEAKLVLFFVSCFTLLQCMVGLLHRVAFMVVECNGVEWGVVPCHSMLYCTVV